MSGFRFRLADQCAAAVEHGDIERDAGPFEHARSGGPSPLGDEFPQLRRHLRVGFPREFQNVLGGIRLARLSAKRGRSARSQKQARKPLIINAPALGVEVEQSLPELRHLGETACNRDPWDRMMLQIFQHPADEIAHFDQGCFREPVKALHGNLGCIPRRAGDVLKSGGAGDVYPTMDRVNPGGAGEWNDDPGGSQDRKAADNAKPRIERLLSQRFAAWDRNVDEDIVQVYAKAFGGFADGERDHSARDGIDRRLAGRHRKTRLGHHTDPFAGAENNPRSKRASADSRLHNNAVRDVRIVSCVLDDAGCSTRAIGFADRHGEGWPSAAGKLDLGYRGAFSGDKRLAGGAGGCSRTSPCGPAPPQRLTSARSRKLSGCRSSLSLFPSHPIARF